jgi:2-iminobutanoate/2-iminopropanoate deaminase
MTATMFHKTILPAVFACCSLCAHSQTAANKIIDTKNAPAPIGPYSQAVQTGNLVFVSGQIGKDPVSGTMKNDNIKDEAAQVMDNVKAVLAAAGLTMDNVVKTTIYLTDINDFKQVNEVYGSYFKADYPARETVEVSHLPAGAKVEISVIAERKQ